MFNMSKVAATRLLIRPTGRIVSKYHSAVRLTQRTKACRVALGSRTVGALAVVKRANTLVLEPRLQLARGQLRCVIQTQRLRVRAFSKAAPPGATEDGSEEKIDAGKESSDKSDAAGKPASNSSSMELSEFGEQPPPAWPFSSKRPSRRQRMVISETEKMALETVKYAQLARVERMERTRRYIWHLIILPLLILVAGFYVHYYWLLSFVKLDPADAKWFVRQYEALFHDTKGEPLKRLENLHYGFAQRAGWDGRLEFEELVDYVKETLKLDISHFPEHWGNVFEGDGDYFEFAGYLRAFILLQWVAQKRDPGWAMAALYAISYLSMDSTGLGRVKARDIESWIKFGLWYDLIGDLDLSPRNIALLMCTKHPYILESESELPFDEELNRVESMYDTLVFTPADFVVAFRRVLLPTSPFVVELERKMDKWRSDILSWKPDPSINPELPQNAFMKKELEEKIKGVVAEKEVEVRVLEEWLQERVAYGWKTGLLWLDGAVKRRLMKLAPFVWTERLNLDHGYWIAGVRDFWLHDRIKSAMKEAVQSMTPDPTPLREMTRLSEMARSMAANAKQRPPQSDRGSRTGSEEEKRK